MVLLLVYLLTLNSKGIESVTRVAVCEHNLRLAGSPLIITQVAAHELDSADGGQNAGVKL